MGKSLNGKEQEVLNKWNSTSRNLLNSWLSHFRDSPKPRKMPYLRHLQHFYRNRKSIVTYRKSV